MATDETGQVEFLFIRQDSAATSSVWWLLSGVLALLFAVAGFCLALFTRLDQLAMHGVTTLPVLFGLGAITAAWSLARTPRQLAVGPKGITIDWRNRTRKFSWDEVGWATVAPGALNMRKQLVIYDAAGKVVAKLSEAFDQFDRMVTLVTERIADKPDDASECIRMSKSKRSAMFITTVAVIMLAVAGLNAWMAHREQRANQLLEQTGIPGEADIVRRFLAPNGVTPRLEYRVTAADGQTATRNAEVTRDYWDSLENATSVPIVYVPSEPEFSRLAMGEPVERDITKNPLIIYGLSAALSLLCLVFLASAWLQWRGWDIDFDSETGKLSIKRFGTGK